jgi:hypothetical protein
MQAVVSTSSRRNTASNASIFNGLRQTFLGILSIGLDAKGGFFMVSTIVRAGTVLSLAVCIAGCGSANDSGAKAQNYPQDGYMGITSANPNDPMNPTHHHYRDDTRMMKAVIAQIPGVADSRIFLKGPTAEVKIVVFDEATPEEAENIRSQVQMALNTNMPRYHVNVSVTK